MEPPRHEQSRLTDSEMSELIKAAKSQHKEKKSEKSKDILDKKSNSKPITTSPRTPVTATNLSSAEHGSYVKGEDGIGGILIDHEVEINKMREKDVTGKKLMSLLDSSSLVVDVGEYKPDYGPDAPEGYDPGVQYIRENPFDPKVNDMMKIKEGFAQFDIGLHGLVDKNSEEAKRVREALNKLRTGEVVLPTPEEYEAQKKAALERREQKQVEIENNPQPSNQAMEENNEPTMAKMPENAFMKKGVDSLLNEINGKNVNEPNEELVPMNRIDLSELETTPVEEPVVEPPHFVLGQPLVPPQPKAVPIDLVELQEELNNDAANTVETTVVQPEPTNTIKAEDIVEINVPAGESETFMQTLPIETYDKVVNAKVIKVNEVELKDVPTKTTRLVDIAKYRMLSKRRPDTKTAEVTERVLINSGFVVTLKAATSLELATIFSSPTSMNVDWEKAYIFCYEHTVGTSLGKLSYNEFLVRVLPVDIETILFGIYEISETDTRKISIKCGRDDGGCGESYEVEATISKLPNYSTLDEVSKERIKKIISIKNSPDETRRFIDNSPSTFVKYIKCGDKTIAVRNTTGAMLLERTDRIDDLSATYGGIVAVLVMYVESIIITYKEREDTEPVNYLIDTLDIICEELRKLTDEEIVVIKDIILDTIQDYPTIDFSIKGPCICPHCGNIKEAIPCTISELVFQKVQSVLE